MLLTKEQEKEIFKRIAKGDKKARQELTDAYIFLVEKVAEKYVDNAGGLAREELIEIGKAGLEKAIDNFNSKKDLKFSAYSTWWIREEIHKKLGIKS